MKIFQSHKQVRAVAIDYIDADSHTAFYRGDDGQEASYRADGLFARHVPEPGDYLVFYDTEAWETGYVSVSPKAVFEASYTVAEEPAQPASLPAN